MIRFFFFLLGFGLSISGMMYNILYLNLLSIGYSLKEYLEFIIHRIECITGFIGILIVIVTIFYKANTDCKN